MIPESGPEGDGNLCRRGGGRTLLSLDAAEGEAGYLSEPADELTSEQIFERGKQFCNARWNDSRRNKSRSIKWHCLKR